MCGWGCGGALGARGGCFDRCVCGGVCCVWPAVWPAFGRLLELRRFRRVGVGVCVGASRSVVVLHLSMWLCLRVGLASGMSRGVCLCHRRTRRRGESAARVVLCDGCFL